MIGIIRKVLIFCSVEVSRGNCTKSSSSGIVFCDEDIYLNSVFDWRFIFYLIGSPVNKKKVIFADNASPQDGRLLFVR